jgi:hypothetical protein
MRVQWVSTWAIYGLQESLWSFWRKVLFNIRVECDMSLKQFGLILIFLNETYSKAHIKILFDVFSVENGLKKGDSLLPLLFSFTQNAQLVKSKNTRDDRNWMWHVSFWCLPMVLIYSFVENMNIFKKNIEALLDASKEVGLEVNME